MQGLSSDKYGRSCQIFLYFLRLLMDQFYSIECGKCAFKAFYWSVVHQQNWGVNSFC